MTTKKPFSVTEHDFFEWVLLNAPKLHEFQEALPDTAGKRVGQALERIEAAMTVLVPFTPEDPRVPK